MTETTLSASPMLTLRPVTPADDAFLHQVYASTRSDELNLVDWDETRKTAFTRMQYNAQAQYYRENYPGADLQVIQVDGQPAGRLYLHRRPAEIRIMEITLLPQFRGLGFGQALLNAVLEEGRQTGRPVTIHVERFNPAMRLYRRLGFQSAGDQGVYLFFKWAPPVNRCEEACDA